jgi:hypothetical protein
VGTTITVSDAIDGVSMPPVVDFCLSATFPVIAFTATAATIVVRHPSWSRHLTMRRSFKGDHALVLDNPLVRIGE